MPAPQSAYIHIPFCHRRCGYCNFSLVAGRPELVPVFLQALEKELQALGQPREMQTLFIGGGTPTSLNPQSVDQLLQLLTQWLPLVPGGEWSVEGNPEDITPDQLTPWAAAGVTRLSLGAQSLSARKLAALDRAHTPLQVCRAVHVAKERFASVSLDLIFAAPGETLQEWQSDLQQALALPMDHVSTYGLTWEKGTRFWGERTKSRLRPCEEAVEFGMYEAGIDTLSNAGFEHYEVSNFARPGHRCLHNEVYWTGGQYLAFGPGAARHVSGVREVNHRSPTTYMNKLLAGESPIAEREALPAEDKARERLVFGLRRLQGVCLPDFQQETGFSAWSLGGEPLVKFLSLGLLEQHGDMLRLTRSGLVVSDALWPELL